MNEKDMSIEKKLRLTASSDEELEILSFLCQDAIFSSEEYYFDNKLKVSWKKNLIEKDNKNSIYLTSR